MGIIESNEENEDHRTLADCVKNRMTSEPIRLSDSTTGLAPLRFTQKEYVIDQVSQSPLESSTMVAGNSISNTALSSQINQSTTNELQTNITHQTILKTDHPQQNTLKSDTIHQNVTKTNIVNQNVLKTDASQNNVITNQAIQTKSTESRKTILIQKSQQNNQFNQLRSESISVKNNTYSTSSNVESSTHQHTRLSQADYTLNSENIDDGRSYSTSNSTTIHGQHTVQRDNLSVDESTISTFQSAPVVSLDPTGKKEGISSHDHSRTVIVNGDIYAERDAEILENFYSYND